MVGPIVAGMVLARCRCCAEPQELVTHPELDASRQLCPATGRVYLDRGDGWYEADGERVFEVAHVESEAESDLLSDRPTRTDAKARISLERATFAAGRR